VITPEPVNDIRTRNSRLMQWLDSIRRKNGWARYRPEHKSRGTSARAKASRKAQRLHELANIFEDAFGGGGEL
jgi:hypothetical protein